MSADTPDMTASGSGQVCSSGGIWPGRRGSQRKEEWAKSVHPSSCLPGMPILLTDIYFIL